MPMYQQQKLYFTVYLATHTALAKENTVSATGEIQQARRSVSSVMNQLKSEVENNSSLSRAVEMSVLRNATNSTANDPRVVLKLGSEPNQTNDYMLLRVSELQANMDLIVLDEFGQSVKAYPIAFVENKIPIAAYKKGCYTLLLRRSETPLRTFRFIKSA